MFFRGLAGNSKTKYRKKQNFDDVNITLTVVNRDEMLSLTVKIQENLDCIIFKAILNLTMLWHLYLPGLRT